MAGQLERLRATLCALIGEQTEKAKRSRRFSPLALFVFPTLHPPQLPRHQTAPSAAVHQAPPGCVGETLCVENNKPFCCISLMKNKGLARDEMHTHEMAAIYITGDGWFYIQTANIRGRKTDGLL